MTTRKIAQLVDVTEAVYMAEYQKIQPILTREATLRSRLAQLQGQRNSAGNQQMRAVGADLVWQAWRERSMQELDMELAQVVARKLELLERVRKAFGRKEAVRQLAQKGAADQTKRRATRDQGS
ncbi:hypothetical protein [Pontibaca salina]|uniref:Uncharacterized protein n=1 Tax=Pontibaca salina TaxID=2795731 RepID=A0A934HSH0_9RHOB|nr:hypothetical protein [Pontibaca salina]MBI6629393.1 hypothetical protein [Pontibaca salina]